MKNNTDAQQNILFGKITAKSIILPLVITGFLAFFTLFIFTPNTNASHIKWPVHREWNAYGEGKHKFDDYSGSPSIGCNGQVSDPQKKNKCAHDNVYVKNLSSGRYKVRIEGWYSKGDKDELVDVESSDGKDSMTIPDQADIRNGKGTHKQSPWYEIDLCEDGGYLLFHAHDQNNSRFSLQVNIFEVKRTDDAPCSSGGGGEDEDTTTTPPKPEPLPAPQGLSANAQCSQDRIRLTWGSVAGAEKYSIHRCTAAGCVPDGVGLYAEVSASDAPPYDDKKPQIFEDGLFRYRVRAFDADTNLWSEYSNITEALYDCEAPPPPPVKVSIGTNKPQVLEDDSSNLVWSSKNADSCVVKDDEGTIVSTELNNAFRDEDEDGEDDGMEIKHIDKDKIYTITCSGPGGVASDSTTISIVVPEILER